MKKIVLSFITLILLSGCEMAYYFINEDLELTFSDIPLYVTDFGDVRNFYDVSEAIRHNVVYKNDSSTRFPADPQTVWLRGWGDCDEKALEFLNIAYVELGIKGEIVFVDESEARKVEDGGFPNHALIRFEGITYSAFTGKVVEYNHIGYSIPFDDIFI